MNFTCPYCLKEDDDYKGGLFTCPSCNRLVGVDMPEIKNKRQAISFGNYIVFIIFAALCFIVYAIIRNDGGHPKGEFPTNEDRVSSTPVGMQDNSIQSNEAPTTMPDGGDAFVISTNYVKDYIKSPSTADFPSAANNVAISSDTFAVNGYFDAENGFGAMIRAKYLCMMKYTRGETMRKENWKLLMLVIDDDVMYMDEGMRTPANKRRHRQ